MKILVTGARGQLGRALQDVPHNHDIVAMDHSELDITREACIREVRDRIRPQCIINAAAYTQVDLAETEQGAAYRVNALGPQHLAIAAEALDIPLVHVSTDYVFDGTQSRPYHEFDSPNPQSVYGKSKLAGEQAVRALTRRHLIVRTAWLYHTIGKNFPKTISELAKRSDVKVVNDQFGSPTFAPHLATAIYGLLEAGALGVFHVAGRGGTNWFELTNVILRQMGIEQRVTPVPTAEFPRPAPRPAYAVLATLRETPVPMPSWEEGVAAFAQQLRQLQENGAAA